MSEGLEEPGEIPFRNAEKVIGQIHLQSLEKELGRGFVNGLNQTLPGRMEIPYDVEKNFDDVATASQNLDRLTKLTSTNAPDIFICAFRYQHEGKEEDALVLTHYLNVEGAENPTLALYLLDPLYQEHAAYKARDVFFTNNKGQLKKLSDLTKKREMFIHFSSNKKYRCTVSEDEFIIRWLAVEGDRAGMFHECGHIARPNDAESEPARRRLGLYNPKGMSSERLDELVKNPQIAKDLTDIVESENDAWDLGEDIRLEWEQDGFPICSQRVFKKNREWAISVNQNHYRPLLDRLSGVPAYK